jgi:hypothetical protein
MSEVFLRIHCGSRDFLSRFVSFPLEGVGQDGGAESAVRCAMRTPSLALPCRGLVFTHIYPCWTPGGVRGLPPFDKRGARGDFVIMLKYHPRLKQTARRLRAAMTGAERRLWCGACAASSCTACSFTARSPWATMLLISEHPQRPWSLRETALIPLKRRRLQRTRWGPPISKSRGLGVLRCSDLEALRQLDFDMESSFQAVAAGKSPRPPFPKGESQSAVPDRRCPAHGDMEHDQPLDGGELERG